MIDGSFFDPSRIEHRSLREAMTEALPFMRGHVLDLGCGTRPYAPIFLPVTTGYTGMDASLEPRPDVCGDASRLPFRHSSFDTVLSTQVIEHVSEPHAMFSEMARVLKPDGHLVLTGPQAWPLHEEPRDFFRFTRYGLEHLAGGSGLTVVILRERSGGVAALFQLLAMLINDKVAKRPLVRPVSKVLLAAGSAAASVLDRILPYEKFTLGYLLVARKPGSS